MSLFWKKVKNRLFRGDFYTFEERAQNFREKGVTIGENCAIYGGCNIDTKHGPLITIGDNVSISPNVTILAHDASTKEVYGTQNKGLCRIAQVKIGNNVGIGTQVIILPGTEIGDNCVIGAGSVVHGKIKKNSIVSGNPAKVVGRRDICQMLYKERMIPENTYDDSSLEDMKRAARELDGKDGYVK